MATFTYTKLADFILDDLFGFSSANSLKNSIRYLAEDVLGDPAANSDEPGVGFSNHVIENYTRTVGTPATARGIAISGSSGAFTTTSGTFVDVTNLSVTITTTGRPVLINIIADGDATFQSWLGTVSTIGNQASAHFNFVRDATEVAEHRMENMTLGGGVTQTVLEIPISCLWHVDVVGAGTYTYKMQAKQTTGNTCTVRFAKLLVMEL